MTLQSFFDTWNGKFCEVAGSANAKNQCVDLANAYLRDVCGLPLIAWTNAVDFPSKFTGGTFIANTPDGVPPMGAVVVFKKYSGRYGDAGHIAVVESASTRSMHIFEQNYPTGSPCHFADRTYAGCVGWFIPKDMTYKGILLTDEQSIKVCIDIWKDVSDGKYASKEDMDALIKSLQEYKTGAEEWKKEYEEEKQKAQGFKEERDNLWKTIAQHTPSDVRQEIPDLVAYLDKVSKYEDTIAELQKQYDKEKNGLLFELEDLKKKNTMLASQVDTNLQRINELQVKIEALQTKSPEKRGIEWLIAWITSKVKG